MKFGSIRYSLIFLILLPWGQAFSQQWAEPDYQDFPSLYIQIDSLSQDLFRSIEEFNNSSLVSDNQKSYQLLDFTALTGAPPTFQYYGLYRDDSSKLILEPMGSDYDSSINQLYAWGSTEASTKNRAAIPPNCKDTLYDTIQVFIMLKNLGADSENIEDLSFSFSAHSDLDLKLDTEIDLGEINENGYFQDTVYHNLCTGEIFVAPPSEIKSSFEEQVKTTESCHNEIFYQYMHVIEYPAIFVLTESDSCSMSVIGELPQDEKMAFCILDTNQELSAIQTLRPVLIGRDHLILKQELERQIKEEQTLACSFRILGEYQKPQLDFKDLLIIENGQGDSLIISIDVPTYIMLPRFKEITSIEVRGYADAGEFYRALDTLEVRRLDCNSEMDCNHEFNILAESILLDFCKKMELESLLDLDTLMALESHWNGGKTEKYIRKKNDVFANDFAEIKRGIHGKVLISFAADIDEDIKLNPQQKADLNFAHYLIYKDKDALKACDYLERYRIFNPAGYPKERISCMRLQIKHAFNNKDYPSVYNLAHSNLALFEDSPECRYMYAESARQTGNLRDAYKHFIWIRNNWNSINIDFLNYESCIDLNRELAFATGDFLQAYLLHDRRYLNMGLREDLTMLLSSYRMYYIGLVSRCYKDICRLTSKTEHLSRYKDYAPPYVQELTVIPKGNKLKKLYPSPLISFPYGTHLDSDKTTYYLENISSGSYLEWKENSGIYDAEIVPLMEQLTAQGYSKSVIKKMILHEKEDGLEFFGLAFKSLASDLISSNKGAFHSFLEEIMSTSIIEYIEYSLDNKVSEIGKCPGEEVYVDKEYYRNFTNVRHYENTFIEASDKEIDEISIPLKEGTKIVGYIRMGLLIEIK